MQQAPIFTNFSHSLIHIYSPYEGNSRKYIFSQLTTLEEEKCNYYRNRCVAMERNDNINYIYLG